MRILTRVQRTTILTCMQYMNSYSRATHKVLLVCFLLACSTQRITHVHHTKYTLRAPHEFYLRVAHFVSHVSFDWATWQKLKTTCVLGTRKCQLECELCRIVISIYGWHHGKLLYVFKVLLRVLTLMNKYTMSYWNTHITTTCILILWFTWRTARRISRANFHETT